VGIEDLGDLISKVSPWVAGGAIIAWCFTKLLEYRRSIREGTDVSRYLATTAALVRDVGAVALQQRETHSMLTAHATRDHADQQTTHGFLQELVKLTTAQISGQISGQSQLVREVVRLNANLSGNKEISTENAKLMIEYQWAWCRDETYRIVTTSIANNHFAGNEERVTRSVQRAWKKAAAQAQESLSRLEGLKFPYERLFHEFLPLIWQRVWKRAIPLYHRDRKSPAFKDDTIEFEAQVKEMFDLALEENYRVVEDLDTGEMYTTKPEENGDTKTTNYMTELLKAYKPGGKGIPSEQLSVREEFRAKVTNTPTQQFPTIKPHG
jgi:hypothetical protein